VELVFLSQMRIHLTDYTRQHDFAVTKKIHYSNGNRCPEHENDVSFFISHLVVVQFCFFGTKMRENAKFTPIIIGLMILR
jgi:hypothetical protein